MNSIQLLPFEIICEVLSYMGGSLEHFDFALGHYTRLDKQMAHDILSSAQIFKNTCHRWRTAVKKYYKPKVLDLSSYFSGPNFRKPKTCFVFNKRLQLAGFSTHEVENFFVSSTVPIIYFKTSFPSLKFLSINYSNMNLSSALEICRSFPHATIFVSGICLLQLANPLATKIEPNSGGLFLLSQAAMVSTSGIKLYNDEQVLHLLQVLQSLIGTSSFSRLDFRYEKHFFKIFFLTIFFQRNDSRHR